MSNEERSDQPEAETAAGSTDAVRDSTDGPDESGDSNGESGGAADAPADEAAEQTDPDRSSPEDRDRELAAEKRRLDERELGLDKRADDLDEREQELNEREQELDRREEELAARQQDLKDWEATLDRRTEELDKRETKLDALEEDLSEKERTLDEHEETLHEYIGGHPDDLEKTIQESMLSALDRYEKRRGSGRFGSTKALLVRLAGLTLVAAGVSYVAVVQSGAAAALFATPTANIALVAVLVISGLALNLGIVADRI